MKHLASIVVVLSAVLNMVFADNLPPKALDMSSTAASECPKHIQLIVSDDTVENSDLGCTVVTPPTNGTISYDSSVVYPTNSYKLIYLSNNGFTGTDSFTYMSNDGVTNSTLATCTITVESNSAPKVSTKIAEVAAEGYVDINLAGTDYHTKPEHLAFTIVTQPSQGTILFRDPSSIPTNSYQITYTSTNSSTGSDYFTYKASDGLLFSGVATCTVYIAENEAPISADMSATANPNMTEKIYLSGTDSHTSLNDLQFDIVSEPTNGTLVYEYPDQFPTNSRTVSYTATNGVINDSFTYSVTDGSLTSAVATCSITVTANTAPSVNPVQHTVPNTLGETEFQLDPDDDDTSAWSLGCTIESQPANGVLSYKYPDSYPQSSLYLNFLLTNSAVGTNEFTYSATDGELTSGVATGLIVVVANTAPSSSDMSDTFLSEQQKNISLTGFDSETSSAYLEFIIVSQPTNGVVNYYYAYAENYPYYSQQVTYTPFLGSTGDDSFTYKINDGELESALATVTLTRDSNLPPSASSASAASVSDASVDISLGVFDAHTASYNLECTIVDAPTNGVVTYQYPSSYPGNSYRITYTPNPGYTGGDSFTYKASDGELESAAAEVTITVEPNTAPSANPMSATGVSDAPLNITLSVSDEHTASYYLECTIVDAPTNGVVTYQYPTSYPVNSYRITYTPNPGYTGADSFTYIASDGSLTSTVATCSVTVEANTAPIASPMSSTCISDIPLDISLSVDDEHTSDYYLACDIVDAPTNGVVTYQYPTSYPLNSYRVTYTPNPGYTGADSFTFRASDGSLTSTVATCSITVELNTPPTCTNMTYDAIYSTPIDISLSATDSHTSTYYLECIVEQPSHGTLEYKYPASYPRNSYQVIYTATNSSYAGVDSFTFTANDGVLTSTVATCSINVATNSAPVAYNNTVPVETNTTTTMPATFLDYDSDQTWTVTNTTSPSFGTLSISGTDFIYTPNNGYTGSDSFNWTVNDGIETSAIATCTINVVNKPRNTVAIIINTNLLAFVQANLDIYVADLQLEGYDTVVRPWNIALPNENEASELRDYLKTVPNLNGAVFIGTVPITSFRTDGEWGISTFPYDLYFMDLVTDWLDPNSDGVIDGPQAEFINPTVWVSRIQAGQMTFFSGMTEADLVNRYLSKIHRFRIGELRLPDKALLWADSDWKTWTPELNIGIAYTNSTRISMDDPGVTTDFPNWKSQWQKPYETEWFMCHSGEDFHQFKESGYLNVYAETVVDGDICRLFWNCWNCSSARYTHNNYIAGARIFAEKYGLLTIGSTKTGSMLDGDDFFQEINNGSSHGTSFVEWFKINDWRVDWHQGMIISGDGTLKLGRFTHTPNPVNQPPVLSAIADVDMATGFWSTPEAFTVSDDETLNSDLLVWAESEDLGLISNWDIRIEGTNINRTISLLSSSTSYNSTTVTVTVCDGELFTEKTFIATLVATNLTPVSDAGEDSYVAANQLTYLDGSGSSDPDGGPDPLSFSWTQIDGTAVTILDATNTIASYTPITSGAITFQLVVSDGEATDVSTVVHTVNVLPIAYDKHVQTAENTPAVNIIPEYIDPDGPTNWTESITTPLYGTLGICEGEGFTYIPNEFTGGVVDQFDYIVSDGRGQSEPATIYILVGELNGTNVIPYRESFESFSPGPSIIGRKGWYANAAEEAAAVISTNAEALSSLASYTGEYPLNEAHTKLLKLTTDVHNEITTRNLAGENIMFDFMVLPNRWELAVSPETPDDSQLALYFNQDGTAVVWARPATGQDPQWNTLTNAVVLNTNTWTRITIQQLYSATESIFSIAMNGAAPITDDTIGTTIEPDTTKCWFIAANQTNNYMSGFATIGEAYIDDVVVNLTDTNSFLSWMTEAYPGNTNYAGTAGEDTDGDGHNSEQEYAAGTDPNNATSVFEMSAVEPKAGDELVLNWSSVEGKFYAIQYGSNLLTGLNIDGTNNIVATPPMNSYTVTVENASPCLFYRVIVE